MSRLQVTVRKRIEPELSAVFEKLKCWAAGHCLAHTRHVPLQGLIGSCLLCAFLLPAANPDISLILSVSVIMRLEGIQQIRQMAMWHRPVLQW